MSRNKVEFRKQLPIIIFL